MDSVSGFFMVFACLTHPLSICNTYPEKTIIDVVFLGISKLNIPSNQYDDVDAA
jgi:hypothetical protein